LEGNVILRDTTATWLKLKLRKTIYAKTEALLNEGKNGLLLSFDKDPDSLIITSPNRGYPTQPKYNKEDCETASKFKHVKLDYSSAFHVVLNVRASTVKRGEVIMKRSSVARTM
jgi:hypothetical protein